MNILNKNSCGFLIICLFMLWVTVPYSQAGSEKLEGNTLVMHGREAFTTGSFQGVALDQEGRIVLAEQQNKGGLSGVYTSPVIHSQPFDELVMSWNAETPVGSSIRVEAQVEVEGKWTPWFSWGEWSSWGKSGSAVKGSGTELASMEIDTLTVRKGKKATAIRYRVQLKGEFSTMSPKVALLAATVNGKAQAKPAISQEVQDCLLEVPQLSQTLRDPRIASRICSPVSVTMLLNYYGVPVIPEETAWQVVDHSQDNVPFGNWSLNCAYPAVFGLEAYVAHFSSMEELRTELLAGRPVAASLVYRNSEEVKEELPVLHNAPIEATEGHLVVVRGWVHKEGKEYVVVNDPAAKTNEEVKRLYLAEEFERAWTKYAYVVKLPANKGISQPYRIKAQVVQEASGVALRSQYAKGITRLADKEIGSIVIINSDKSARFLPPDTPGNRIWKESQDSQVFLIGKQHQVFLIEP